MYIYTYLLLLQVTSSQLSHCICLHCSILHRQDWSRLKWGFANVAADLPSKWSLTTRIVVEPVRTSRWLVLCMPECGIRSTGWRGVSWPWWSSRIGHSVAKRLLARPPRRRILIPQTSRMYSLSNRCFGGLLVLNEMYQWLIHIVEWRAYVV